MTNLTGVKEYYGEGTTIQEVIKNASKSIGADTVIIAMLGGQTRDGRANAIIFYR